MNFLKRNSTITFSCVGLFRTLSLTDKWLAWRLVVRFCIIVDKNRCRVTDSMMDALDPGYGRQAFPLLLLQNIPTRLITFGLHISVNSLVTYECALCCPHVSQ